MRQASFLRVFMVFLSSIVLFSCSSGGGGGGGGDEVVAPQLSAVSAFPGEYISITHESIKAGQESSVEFSAAGGYGVTVKIDPEADGSVRAGVPIYLDPANGANAAGAVTVKVNGTAASGVFTIKAIPELGIKAGDVYVLFLEKINAEMELTKGHLSDIMDEDSIDFLSGAMDKLDAKILQNQAMITQIRTTRTLTVTPVEGTTRTLSTDELKQVDQWLASWILGLEAEMRGVTAQSGVALDTTYWQELNAEEKKAALLSGIEYSVDETKRGVKLAAMWLTAESLQLAAGGYAVMVEAGQDIAGAGGLALTYLQATWELGTTAITEKMADSFSTKSREAYDWSSDILKQAYDITLSWLSTMKNKIGKLAEIIDTKKDISSIIKDAEEVLCNGEGGSFLIPSGAFSGITVMDFCGNEVVIGDILTAVVSIGDYSASFAFTGTLATLGTIDDGQGHVLLGDIPSIIGTDGDLDMTTPGALVNQDTLLIMFDPALAGPFPRTISLTTDELMEGGEAQVTYSSPHIPNWQGNNPYDPVVIFAAVGGSITVEHFGTVVGDLLKGTFSIDVEGERDIDDDNSEVLTGTITGSFEGVLSEPPGS